MTDETEKDAIVEQAMLARHLFAEIPQIAEKTGQPVDVVVLSMLTAAAMRLERALGHAAAVAQVRKVADVLESLPSKKKTH